MSDYVLDSGILIRHLRDQRGYPELVDQLTDKADVYISAMTRLEVVRGMRDRERENTFDLIASLETISITGELADSAGELIRAWRKRGITLGDADAIIAATALQHSLTLVTTNPKHFPMTDLSILQADEQGNLSPYKSA